MIDDRDRDRLRDMPSYAKDALELLGDSDPAALAGHKMRFYAVTRAMEIVGEAASQVSSACRESLPTLPWSGAIRTRNRLIHAYRGLDVVVMVATVRQDVPLLIDEPERLLGNSSP
ncbi:MAG: HepT-like ribonuclease domain-containing protein [Caulobacteraceae bacterium]